MKVLVSGASGFLGSALCHHLARQGHEVVAMLRPGSSMRRLEGFSGCIEHCGSVTDVLDMVRAQRPAAVIHTACAYGRQGESLLQMFDANLRLGMALLQALAAPVGDSPPPLFLNTGTALPREVSDYALSKHQFAEWGHRTARGARDRLRFVNVELQHMYGAGDDLSKFTTSVLRACRNHVPSLALTAGEQERDFIYIDDVVDGFAFLLQHASRLPMAIDVPLGSGEAPSIRDYVTLAHELCCSCTELQFGAVPYRAGEAMHCLADLTLMRELGWEPHWKLRAGLNRTLELEVFE